MTTYFKQMRTFTISLAMGLIGLCFGLIMYVLHEVWSAFYLPETSRFLLAAFVGGCTGGLASAWAFGRNSRHALLISAMGAVLATIIGAAVGGSLFAPGYGTLMGMIAVADALFSYPLTLLLWAGMMLVLHFALSKWPSHLVAS
ncbi:hypothetical protein [Parasulfitobacter algicola]|uniref:Uncharacterized protein n=1 Tax=Parasulfitobacter algicola TaxID=2614809 RepID=A0ABX2IVH2_9RHOB|nr:hypothetical protein [Sulfitobacter algicola]NSX54369.1 hypothetical protein [Sulfitobacter algicola]